MLASAALKILMAPVSFEPFFSARRLLPPVQAMASARASEAWPVPPAQVPAVALSSPPSAREAQVLSLVARGHTVEEVAGVLGVSPHTVQTFVRRIYTKLQVNSRAEAIREAVRQGWLSEH